MAKLERSLTTPEVPEIMSSADSFPADTDARRAARAASWHLISVPPGERDYRDSLRASETAMADRRYAEAAGLCFPYCHTRQDQQGLENPEDGQDPIEPGTAFNRYRRALAALAGAEAERQGRQAPDNLVVRLVFAAYVEEQLVATHLDHAYADSVVRLLDDLARGMGIAPRQHQGLHHALGRAWESWDDALGENPDAIALLENFMPGALAEGRRRLSEGAGIPGMIQQAVFDQKLPPAVEKYVGDQIDFLRGEPRQPFSPDYRPVTSLPTAGNARTTSSGGPTAPGPKLFR